MRIPAVCIKLHQWQGRFSVVSYVLLLNLFSGFAGVAQSTHDTHTLAVDLNEKIGKMYSVWAFGYDESNVTYEAVGKKLISELNEASPVPVYYRTHNLLNTDEGPRIALKWGSSNVYTEDEQGNPVYDWTIIDKTFDTYLERGGKPNVTIAQMPKALTSGPEPYRHNWSPDPNNQAPYSNTVRTGYHYPPNDYKKWAELIYQWVTHCVDRYGKEEVESWWWDVWDEPNGKRWVLRSSLPRKNIKNWRRPDSWNCSLRRNGRRLKMRRFLFLSPYHARGCHSYRLAGKNL